MVTTEPEAVTIGGLDGYMIDVAMDPSWTGTCPFSEGQPIAMTLVGTDISRGVHWGVAAGESQRVFILDLGQPEEGHNIAIVIEACCDPALSDLASDEFHDRVATVTPVVDSFQFAS